MGQEDKSEDGQQSSAELPQTKPVSASGACIHHRRHEQGDQDEELEDAKKSGTGRVTNVPIDFELMEVEQENLEERRVGRPEKKVTWSRDLLQVRSISPRQKSPRTPKLADSPRTSRMSEAVNTMRGGPSVTQEGDCGHFLCQRVGGVCLQAGGGEQQQGGGNLRPGYQATNTGYQATKTCLARHRCRPWSGEAFQSAERATTITIIT